jgi:superfamily II DNA or RNA helicase
MLGGGEQRVKSITVTTYDSAYLRTDESRDIARLLAAPARLGLTATSVRRRLRWASRTAAGNGQQSLYHVTCYLYA